MFDMSKQEYPSSLHRLLDTENFVVISQIFIKIPQK